VAHDDTISMFDLEEGEERKEKGLAQVEATDAEGNRWVDRARLEAIRVAKLKGQVTADDLRAWANSRSDFPHHPNAWGAVFRGKAWRAVGYRKSTFKTNNARRIAVWKYDPKANA